jgi:hypothetical protein
MDAALLGLAMRIGQVGAGKYRRINQEVRTDKKHKECGTQGLKFAQSLPVKPDHAKAPMGLLART